MTGLPSWTQKEFSARHTWTRFWVRLVLAAVSAVLLVGTVAWPDWIEIVFRADPDHGSGWLEWAIVIAASSLMVMSSVDVGRQWASRRAAVGDGAS